MAKYKVTQSAVTQLLEEVKSEQIAIPELQRPFVWDSVKVRDLRTRSTRATRLGTSSPGSRLEPSSRVARLPHTSRS